MTADQSGKVRIRVLDSDPATQQVFYQCAKEKLKSGHVPYGAYCAVPGLFYGSGARADARIRTTVPDPSLTPQTAPFNKSKIVKNMTGSTEGRRGSISSLKISQ